MAAKTHAGLKYLSTHCGYPSSPAVPLAGMSLPTGVKVGWPRGIAQLRLLRQPKAKLAMRELAADRCLSRLDVLA